MADPTLLIIAHGSRDARHPATVAALAARVRSLRPRVRVEESYLDFQPATVPGTLRRLHDEGVRDVVALPLLLNRAFHAKTDVPSVLRETLQRLPRLSVTRAGVLGPHPLLRSALERRLHEAGLPPGDTGSTGVVLASAGSSDPEANAVIAETAREWRRTSGWCAVRPAFASASPPRTADVVRELRALGARRVVVSPYVLAPGRLPDRIAADAREAGADVLAPVLGDAPEVAELVTLRYDQARTEHRAPLSA